VCAKRINRTQDGGYGLPPKPPSPSNVYLGVWGRFATGWTLFFVICFFCWGDSAAAALGVWKKAHRSFLLFLMFTGTNDNYPVSSHLFLFSSLSIQGSRRMLDIPNFFVSHFLYPDWKNDTFRIVTFFGNLLEGNYWIQNYILFTFTTSPYCE